MSIFAGSINNPPFLSSKTAGQLTGDSRTTIGGQHITGLQLQRDGAISVRFPLESGGRPGSELVATVRDVERVVVSNHDSSNGAEDEIVSGTHIDEKILYVKLVVVVLVGRLSSGLKMRAEELEGM